MEGGYLPWKNHSKEVVDELEALGKPLPPPPSGMRWVRIEDGDGSWQLQEIDRLVPVTGIQRTVVADSPMVVEHTVMPDDTLQGLCLRYHVSVTEVRRINLFSGNSIQYKKTLLIPVSPGVSYNSVVQQGDSREVMLQRFRNATGEAAAEARIYMEEHSWNLDEAVAAWKKDESWEGNNTHNLQTGSNSHEDSAGTVVDSGHVSLPGITHVQTVFARTIETTTDDSINNTAARSVSPIAVRVSREVAPMVVVEMPTMVPS